MIIEDDRTQEQKETHTCLIIGTDSFMSGWGKAQGGVSYAAWACESKDRFKVMKWVENRNEMKRVRVVFETLKSKYRPKGKGHCHIYVVTEGHVSLE